MCPVTKILFKRGSALGFEDVPGGEVNEGKAFGDVGVVDAVPVKGPSGGRTHGLAAEVQRFETGKVHPPGISVLWGE